MYAPTTASKNFPAEFRVTAILVANPKLDREDESIEGDDQTEAEYPAHRQ